MFIAATVPVENSGDVSPLLEAAKLVGEKDNPDEEQSSDSGQRAPDDNGIGSYERFMSSFGSPARWAGRS